MLIYYGYYIYYNSSLSYEKQRRKIMGADDKTDATPPHPVHPTHPHPTTPPHHPEPSPPHQPAGEGLHVGRAEVPAVVVHEGPHREPFADAEKDGLHRYRTAAARNIVFPEELKSEIQDVICAFLIDQGMTEEDIDNMWKEDPSIRNKLEFVFTLDGHQPFHTPNNRFCTACV
jgi:hypothetical protein